MKIRYSLRKALPVVSIAFAVHIGLAAHAQAQEKSVEDIINKMTLDEKLDYITGFGLDFTFLQLKGVFNIRPIEHLGLPLIYGADGGIGFTTDGFTPGTRFPAGPLLASTWNPDLAYEFGVAHGREGSARGIHRSLAPGVDFYRTAFGGRSFEYLTGEDPFLGAALVAPAVRGMQSQRVMATTKHFVANDQEVNRTFINVVADERTLREIYLPPFEAAVKLGDTAAIMSAFNGLKGDFATDKVNGDFASESKFLITRVLRKDWGFNGFVESDFVGIHNGLKAAQAGTDLDMPGFAAGIPGVTDRRRMVVNAADPTKPPIPVLRPAIERGDISVEDINDKVRRILRTISSYDFVKNPPKSDPVAIEEAAKKSKEVAIQSAREGIVLLENKKNFLPLNRHSIKKIAVIGRNANGEPPTGAGSAFVPAATPPNFISEIDGINSLLTKNAKVDYFPELVPDPSTAEWQTETGLKGLEGKYFNTPDLSGAPVATRVDPFLDFTRFTAANVPDPSINPTSFSGIWTGKITPKISGDHFFKGSSGGNIQIRVNGELILDSFPPPTPPNPWPDPETPASASAPFVPISGKITLQAGVPATIEIRAKNLGRTRLFNLPFLSVTGLRVSWAPLQPPADLKSYDAVVLAVGGNEDYDGEAHDRSFRLPEFQDDLIVNAVKLNPRTIVVLHGGGGFNVQAWVNKVPALLHAWFPGQYGGQALAEILFGAVNPSGKLPITIEKRVQDNPAFATFPLSDPGALEIKYSEGLFGGYRGYERNRIKPQYPFGYGLSYTNFRYSDIEVDPMVLKKNILRKDDDLVRVSFRVRNTGKLPGAEIAQLYVAPLNPPVERPLKELKGFQKVYLGPGESKKVTITLDRRSLAYYNVATRTWDVAAGAYRILVGSSSQDIELQRPLVNLFPSSLSVLDSSPVPGAKRASDLLSISQSVPGKAAAPGAPALTVEDGSGSGRHDAGTIVKVTADPPPPREKFAGWSGDTQILANPSEPTTTATMPSIDVTITATYSEASMQ
jgi:beta-glucosidase